MPGRDPVRARGGYGLLRLIRSPLEPRGFTALQHEELAKNKKKDTRERQKVDEHEKVVD